MTDPCDDGDEPWHRLRQPMSDAQKLIADVLDLHRYGIADSPVHRCICGAEVGRADDAINKHRAAEIDKALGGLTRGTSGQWVTRQVIR